MKIQESAENYLETILVLKKKNGVVRSIDIANDLGVSKPSVSVAMKNLRNGEYIEMDKIAIVRNAEGEIKAFATIMPMYDNKTLSVDLMRFKDIQLNGIMDFIFVNLFEYSKENGYEFFNLGLVPLAEVGESKYSFIREKIAYQIFINGNFIYSFKGLKKFKDKYASKWDDKYIAYKKESSLLITCIQLLTILSQDKKD